MDEYQHRFRAFLLHTGREDPSNTEYILWISQKWREWQKLHGVDSRAKITPEQHDQFTAWLFETVPAGQLEMQF